MMVALRANVEVSLDFFSEQRGSAAVAAHPDTGRHTPGLEVAVPALAGTAALLSHKRHSERSIGKRCHPYLASARSASPAPLKTRQRCAHDRQRPRCIRTRPWEPRRRAELGANAS